jgi:hypothetical protein
MRKTRLLICGVSAAAFLALGVPVWSQSTLNVEALNLYGGTYSSDCSRSAAPRLLVVADALVVEAGGKRMIGHNVMAAPSYFGPTPPPNYVMALLSSVGAEATSLGFIVYRDRAGQYIVLDGGPRVMGALGNALAIPHYRRCSSAVTGASTPLAGQPQAASVSALPPTSPICGTQPFCVDVSSFSATITDFRAILQNTNNKTLTVRIGFRNKLNRPVILGYVSGSGIATDDRGNRYAPYGERAVQGIGQISGSNAESKFILLPGESSDARFEFVWNTSGREIFGLAFQMDLAIREIDQLPGNQIRLGREYAIHFSGLGDGARSGTPAAPPTTTATAQPPVSGEAPVSPVAAAAPQVDACSGKPRCSTTGPFVVEVTGVTPSQSAYGYHMLQVNVRFRNLMSQPLILAYVARSGVITDNNGKRYEESGALPSLTGARGIGTVRGDQADPQFVLGSGASSNASFVLARGHRSDDPRDPIGTTFSFDLSIAHLEVLPSQQIRPLRVYSVGFTGLDNTVVSAGSSPGAQATAQPPVTGDAASSAAPQVDACSGKPRCYSDGPFMVEVTGVRPSQSAYGFHLLEVNVRFRNLMSQPLILAYVARSGVITDNNGKRYEESGALPSLTGARGIGTVRGDQADPQFVLRPGAPSNASFVLARSHAPNDPRDPIGATFSFDLSISQLEVLPSQQIRTVREYSVDLGGLTAPPSVRNALRDIFKN